MPEDDVGSLGRAIVVYEYIRQKCRFDLKSEGKKKNLAHVVSLLVFKERCGGGRKKKQNKTKQNKTKKKPLRRDGWVVHNKRKGVSPERSGGHQFCHFLAYSVILHFINKRKNDFYF